MILAIMLSYLRKTNQNNLKRYVFGGVALSIVASVATAIIMAGIWGIFEESTLAMFEGSVVLVASFLLTTMILWMWKAGSGISSEIEGSMQRSTGVQSGIGLLLLSFALILREGVELVLFTTALVIQDGLVTYLGMALGLAIAFAIGIGIYQGSLKISLKALFNSTSILLVLFAAGMIAYGIHELQEAGLLLIGPIEVWNINPPLLPDGSYPLLHEKGAIGSLAKTLFGYNGNPSALEVVAYISYLLIVSGYYILRREQNEPTPVSDHPVPVVTS